jgi:hypothetical protein
MHVSPQGQPLLHCFARAGGEEIAAQASATAKTMVRMVPPKGRRLYYGSSNRKNSEISARIADSISDHTT